MGPLKIMVLGLDGQFYQKAYIGAAFSMWDCILHFRKASLKNHPLKGPLGLQKLFLYATIPHFSTFWFESIVFFTC